MTTCEDALVAPTTIDRKGHFLDDPVQDPVQDPAKSQADSLEERAKVNDRSVAKLLEA
jgi:hypothetical protein